MLDKSPLKYSLLLVIHPRRLFPHIMYLEPQPTQLIVDRSIPLFEARRKAIEQAAEPYSLILDNDVTIPNEFLVRSYEKLMEGFHACTMYYETGFKHTSNTPPFSPSMWLTQKLKELYDYQNYTRNYKPIHEKSSDNQGNTFYKITNPFMCECNYMYAKLAKDKLCVFTDLTAKHLKPQVR